MEIKDYKQYFDLQRDIQEFVLNKTGWLIDWITSQVLEPVISVKEKTDVQRLKELRIYERSFLSSRITCEEKDRWFIDWQLEETYEEIDKIMKKRRFAKAVKSGKLPPYKPLEEIRAISITNFLKIDKNTPIKCLWHNDINPSMRLHPTKNYVHCFACSKTGSVIDVYMALNNCSVAEAIKDLNKYSC